MQAFAVCGDGEGALEGCPRAPARSSGRTRESAGAGGQRQPASRPACHGAGRCILRLQGAIGCSGLTGVAKLQLQLDSEPAGDQLNSAYGSMKEAMRSC